MRELTSSEIDDVAGGGTVSQALTVGGTYLMFGGGMIMALPGGFGPGAAAGAIGLFAVAAGTMMK